MTTQQVWGKKDYIIISPIHFKENDTELAIVIGKMKKNFIWTNVDSDLDSEQRCKTVTLDKERILQKIWNNCLEKLLVASVKDPQVFLVFSICVSDWFPKPGDHSSTGAPSPQAAHKKHIFMQCLLSITEAAIDGKRDSLKQKVWLEALNAESQPLSLLWLGQW